MGDPTPAPRATGWGRRRPWLLAGGLAAVVAAGLTAGVAIAVSRSGSDDLSLDCGGPRIWRIQVTAHRGDDVALNASSAGRYPDLRMYSISGSPWPHAVQSFCLPVTPGGYRLRARDTDTGRSIVRTIPYRPGRQTVRIDLR